MNNYTNLYKKYNRKHIAQYALTVDNKEDSKSFNEDLKKINKSLCGCGKYYNNANVNKKVEVKETENSRHLSGLISCGNSASCPTCAAKLSSIRGNELSELMEAGRENNRSYIMLVNTIQHKAKEPLDITLNQVLEMSRYAFNSKKYKKFKELTNLRFVHSSLEFTVSVKNSAIDWHPHKNFLLDFDITTGEILKRLSLSSKDELSMYISTMFTNLCQDYLDKNNIKKTLLKPYFNKNMVLKGGCSTTIENFNDKYIAKWGLEAELTASIYKDSKNSESFHPFLLLDLIDKKNKNVSKADKYKYSKAFQEFVLSAKGKSFFRFAMNSIKYYNENYNTEIRNKKDKEALKEQEKKGITILTLNEEEWASFKPTPKKIGQALSLKTSIEVCTYIFEEIEKNRVLENDDGLVSFN